MVEFLINTLKAFIPVGLIFFIGNGAIKTINYKVRAIYNLFIGLGLLILFLLAFLIDNLLKTVYIYYLVFPIVVLFYTITLFLIFYIMGHKRNHKLKKYKSISDTNLDRYLYIVYKYQDSLLLNQSGEGLTGIIKIFKNTVFHDQMLELVNKNLNVVPKDIKYVGTASIKKKKNIIYYAYLVEVDNLDNLSHFIKVNMYDVMKQNLSPFHQEMILRIIIGDNFNINL